ncbi:MAG TPA: alkaline phosphatase, partial [Myxococcota bacterium]|nr:alkaline phosphatase [Myxococcota bacterium]
APPDLTPRALVIGIDGLRADAFDAAPALREWFDAGALTLAGRTQRTGPTTVSGPGWASILTGVEVEDHGVTGNDDLGDRSRAWPTFPERAVDAGLGVGVAVHWLGILALLGGLAPDALFTGDDAGVGATATAWVDDPTLDLVFTHFDDVDHAGHASGFSVKNPDYVAAIAGVDAAIAPALDAIAAREGEAWRVIVCADHGGLGTDHGARSADTETIPLGVTGGDPRVPPDPTQMDVAPTALAWLGVPYEGLDGAAW